MEDIWRLIRQYKGYLNSDTRLSYSLLKDYFDLLKSRHYYTDFDYRLYKQPLITFNARNFSKADIDEVNLRLGFRITGYN